MLLQVTGGWVCPAGEVAAAQVREGFPVTVKDDLGRSVRFDAPPRRIISLSPGYTETLFALGLGDRVVGVDEYSDYPAEVLRRPKVAGAHHHNLEQIVLLQPDLVVTLVERGELLDGLMARGIRTLKLFPDDFEGVLRSILLLGNVTATTQRAREIVEQMRACVDVLHSRVRNRPQRRVFFELDGSDPSRPFTPGPHSFIGDMIRIAGGLNIAGSARTSSSQISLEAIVAADPEIIILGDANNPVNPQRKESVLARGGWSQMTAVRKRNVYPVDSALFFRPGPRVTEGIKALAWIFYPEEFH